MRLKYPACVSFQLLIANAVSDVDLQVHCRVRKKYKEQRKKKKMMMMKKKKKKKKDSQLKN